MHSHNCAILSFIFVSSKVDLFSPFLLICWSADRLICWSIDNKTSIIQNDDCSYDLLICWSIDLLIYWSDNLLIFQRNVKHIIYILINYRFFIYIYSFIFLSVDLYYYIFMNFYLFIHPSPPLLSDKTTDLTRIRFGQNIFYSGLNGYKSGKLAWNAN